MTKIILVPGLLCSPRLWQFQVDALGGEHEVRVFDHRRDDDYAAMAERLLDEVPGSFALVGLSMGGYLAQEVVARAPDRVERLALTCTRAEPDTEETRRRRMEQAAEAAAGRFEAIAAELGQGWLAERNRMPANLALLAEMARHTGAEAFGRQQRAIAGRRDMRPLLGQISCPTLVLCGSEDRLTVPEGHIAMARAIPDADLVILGGCGHLAPLERPDAVTDALRSWLRR
ncbi:alpha/beta fold hydrolase [Geminicoccus harenae]|uniref:alpha/beta fold hydrolase n=3 Tax=Geminicoccus harenae TaxID=2498453 RepID=UPI001C97880C|nr:alpha/beta fold hydrolase [Geminicoccus harenae]